MSNFCRDKCNYKFDFSSSPIKVNGIAQDKPGLIYLIGTIDYDIGIASVRQQYSELVNTLLTLLQQNDFKNVTTI
jgi:hypothetical protein